MVRHVSWLAAGLFFIIGQLFAAEDIPAPLPRDEVEVLKTSQSGISIDLFGCIMPLPPGYILRADTQSFEKLHFYSEPRGYARGGMIDVHPFHGIDTQRLEILRKTKIGSLTVVTIRMREAFLPSSPTLSIIHDNQTSLSIAGDDENWAEHMARACAENPSPRR